MTPLPEILTWIASHAQRLKREGYTPPNHLANGRVRYFGADGTPTFDLALDADGCAPDYTHDPPPRRIEVYDQKGTLLYAEGL